MDSFDGLFLEEDQFFFDVAHSKSRTGSNVSVVLATLASNCQLSDESTMVRMS